MHWLRLLVLNFCGIDYRLARERFIDDVTDHQRNKDIWNITAIPTTFPFYEYLRLQQSMFHVALVEITATSWLCLPVALSVMYYLSFTSLHTQVPLCTPPPPPPMQHANQCGRAKAKNSLRSMVPPRSVCNRCISAPPGVLGSGPTHNETTTVFNWRLCRR